MEWESTLPLWTISTLFHILTFSRTPSHPIQPPNQFWELTPLNDYSISLSSSSFHSPSRETRKSPLLFIRPHYHIQNQRLRSKAWEFLREIERQNKACNNNCNNSSFLQALLQFCQRETMHLPPFLQFSKSCML